MGNEPINFNINGQNFSLNAGMQLNNVKAKDAKIVLSIFDTDKDGKLSKNELDLAKQLSAGKYSVETDNYGSTVSYVEDSDNNGKPEYTSTWFMNTKGHLTGRVQDLDGDGEIDKRDLYKLNDDGSVIEHTEVAIENGVSHASVNPKPFESHPTHSFTDALEKAKKALDGE